MEIIEMNAHNVIDGFNEVIKNRKQCFVYGVPDGNYVFTGTTNSCNCEYCEKNNVKILPIPNEGGVIVVNKGDVEIAIFKDNGYDICRKYMKILFNELKTKIPNISLEGNDMMIDGKYKCIGSSSRNLSHPLTPYVYTAIHISLDVDLELIKHICQKEMKKIPKGLSEYGFTTEEVINISIDALNKLEDLLSLEINE